MACEFRTSVKNARYFLRFGMVFNDLTISFCSSVKNDFFGDVKGRMTSAVLLGLSFALGPPLAPTVLAHASGGTGVLTPSSDTSCATPTKAPSMRCSKFENMCIKRCRYDSEPSMALMRARERFEDLEKRYRIRLASMGTKSGRAAIIICVVWSVKHHMGTLIQVNALGLWET